MKLTTKIGATAIALLITVGGSSAAFAAGTGSGNGGENSTTGNRPKVEQLCAHKDQIVARLTERQTNLNTRISKLTELSKKAADNGHTDRAAKIDKRIARLQTELDRVTKRIAAAPAFIAKYCA
jgi:predicted RNase H-like nuclease (RuvC/YqgF family)